MLEKNFDFRIAGIIKEFNLRHMPSHGQGWLLQEACRIRPCGQDGHGTAWEVTEKISAFRR